MLIELLQFTDLAGDIMDTHDLEKLLLLHENMQEIAVPDHLAQMWSDSLERILHESNSAKVCQSIIYSSQTSATEKCLITPGESLSRQMS